MKIILQRFYLIHIPIVFYLTGISLLAQSQPLQFAHISFPEALQRAENSGQIIFLHLESECGECNTVADIGLSTNNVYEIYSKFICLKIPYQSDDYQTITTKYRIKTKLPSSIFIDSEGNYLAGLLNRSSSRSNDYIMLVTKALSAEKDNPLKTAFDISESLELSREMLKIAIEKLNKEGLYIDDLVEKYIDMLTIKELENEDELKFLLRTAPLIDSKVYRFLKWNNEIYSTVFNSLPFEERVRINRQIIAKSKEKAINTEDRNYLFKVTNYLQGTYDDFKIGWTNKMIMELEYFKEVNDSKSYLSHAKQLYERFFVQLDMDSVYTSEINKTRTVPDGTVVFGPGLYTTANLANNIAFAIFEMNDDKDHLGFALKLSEITLRYEVPQYTDTYAQILFKLGGMKDAVEWQKKAIEKAKSMRMPTEMLQTVLTNMEKEIESREKR